MVGQESGHARRRRLEVIRHRLHRRGVTLGGFDHRVFQVKGEGASTRRSRPKGLRRIGPFAHQVSLVITFDQGLHRIHHGVTFWLRIPCRGPVFNEVAHRIEPHAIHAQIQPKPQVVVMECPHLVVFPIEVGHA